MATSQQYSVFTIRYTAQEQHQSLSVQAHQIALYLYSCMSPLIDRKSVIEVFAYDRKQLAADSMLLHQILGKDTPAFYK